VKQFITFLFSWGGSSIIANFSQILLLWQRESMGENAIGSIQWPVPENFPIGAKNFTKISYASRVQANVVPNFVATATGVGRGKMQLAAFDGPSPKPPYRHKNLLHKPNSSQFCLKLRCHGNGGRSGENAIGCIRWPIPENPPICAKISQKFFMQAKL